MTWTNATLGRLLDELCPMHAVLSKTGHVIEAGPTLRKVFDGSTLAGARFLDLIDVRRPHSVSDMAAFRACEGARLRLRLCAAPHTPLKGVLLGLSDGAALVNLSFGISIVDAVRDFGLTGADFAATDLATEMLYLFEAKSAAMDASRTLNMRLQGARVEAEERAFTDTLTGLQNRRALDHVLDRLTQSEQDFALMHVDLDFFKQVNDTLGHAAGDHVLRAVAGRLLGEVRADDLVSRVGGDEFVVILSGLTDRCRLDDMARRIIERLEEPVPYEGQDCRISASIGATMSCEYDIPDSHRMMVDSDRALYAAKGRGRGCHVIHEWLPNRD
ncbi:GGDEF domain-containing protein [uncultured Roseovarius sp.]|uniref:GGDEF domain-containing protein n=1 Tax=uncultured Roseovarius sp. TaxID=293344 RepID=UPI002637B1D0|nr:GGDEF domain-containing protein [uncultured Roseovarius sp.]